MQLGSTVIVTPIDNPSQFDPDWRNSIAMILADDPSVRIDPDYAAYRNDKWIRMQLGFFDAERRRMRLTPKQRSLRLANIWFQGNANVSDTKFRLEPLLLTAAPFETIALDLLGDDDDATAYGLSSPVDAIQAYERLYFNSRMSDGRLNPSCQLRQYFSLPDGQLNEDTPPETLWKMIGALLGYDTLVAIWLWKDAHGIENSSQTYLLDEMWRVAQSRLFLNMFADRIGHESMAKLLASITAQSKMLKEDSQAGSASLDTIKTLMAFLGKTGPVVLNSIARSVDENPELSRQLESEAVSRRAILQAPAVARSGEGAEDAVIEVPETHT